MSFDPKAPGALMGDSPGAGGAAGGHLSGIPTSVTALVGRAAQGPVGVAVGVQDWADFQRVFGAMRDDMPLTHAVRSYIANGGDRAVVVRVAPDKPATEALDLRMGLAALTPVPWVNLLCLPPDGAAHRWVQEVLPALVSSHEFAWLRHQRGLLWLVDTHPATSALELLPQTAALAAGLRATLSDSALLCGPQVLVPGVDQPEVPAPASAFVAARLARSDRSQGVWLPLTPVGRTLRRALGLRPALDAHDPDALRELGANPLFIDQGAVRMPELRTLGDGPRARLEVRRVWGLLEGAMRLAVSPYVGRRNSEGLQRRVRSALTTLTLDLQGQGAFQDSWVRCPPAAQDSHSLTVEMGFQPRGGGGVSQRRMRMAVLKR